MSFVIPRILTASIIPLIITLLPVSAHAQLLYEQESCPLDIKGKETTRCAIYIENLLTGDVVMDVNGDLPMLPASVTKIVTSATALSQLPSEHTFDTQVCTTGRLDKRTGLLRGNVVIKAVGDPTIESRHFPEYSGVADSIAAALQRAGVRTVGGKIMVTYPKALEEGVPSGWTAEDLSSNYGTAHHALNFADNLFTLTMPSKTMQPHQPDLKVSAVAAKRPLSAELDRKSGTINVRGRLRRQATFRLPMMLPEQAFIHAVKEALKERGISVEDGKESMNDPVTVYTHQSPPLTDILRSLMFRSDNLMAEGMLRALNPQVSRKDAVASEMALWFMRDVDTAPINIEDGSGLSRNNRLTAYFLADIMVWMREKQPYKQFHTLFPKVGSEGTVRNFMKDSSLDGRLALKTGSLRNVQSYAGYALDPAGEPTHVVVVIVNDFSCSRSELKRAISDLFLRLIA